MSAPAFRTASNYNICYTCDQPVNFKKPRSILYDVTIARWQHKPCTTQHSTMKKASSASSVDLSKIKIRQPNK